MSNQLRPDIVIADRNSKLIAVVEVKSRASSPHDQGALAQLRHYVAALGDPNTFAILADPDYIRIYRGDLSDQTAPVTIASPDILRYYDADYESQVAYEPYLTSLIEAWLNDLSIHWQSEHPPGEKSLPEELVTRLQAA